MNIPQAIGFASTANFLRPPRPTESEPVHRLDRLKWAMAHANADTHDLYLRAKNEPHTEALWLEQEQARKRATRAFYAWNRAVKQAARPRSA